MENGNCFHENQRDGYEYGRIKENKGDFMCR
jgi:hypothetical protein